MIRNLDDYVEVPIDAEAVEILDPSAKAATTWPVTIATPVAPWSYAAYIAFPPRAKRVRDAVLRVRVRSVKGNPWLGVLTRDHKEFVTRKLLEEGDDGRDQLFSELDLPDASVIVVENGADRGPSFVTVESASLLVPRSSRGDLLPNDALPTKSVRLDEYRFAVSGLSENDPYFKSIGNNFEPEFQAFCRSFIREDAICIDIGANIGLKSLFLSRHARKGRVVAIEASPRVAKCLRENIAANAARNVECVQAAIGESVGSVRFAEISAYGHIAADGIEVPLLTLEEAVGRLSLPRIDFVKIDVEGFEFPILRNAIDLINRNRAIVLMEFNSWCQIAFSDVNPKEFLGWIFEHFSYVAILRGKKGPMLEEVTRDQLLYVLHDNLVENACVTDLVVTNARDRLSEGKERQA